MSIQHFIIPLNVEGQHSKATLVFDATGTKGTINVDKNHVCDFALETPWAVSDYYTAERMVRHMLSDVLGLDSEPIDTGLDILD